MAYASCPDCNVTYQINAQSLDGVLCQQCGGEVNWLVPPAAVSVEDKDTPMSMAPSVDRPIHFEGESASENSEPSTEIEPQGIPEVDPPPKARQSTKSVAPSPVPSQDRSTRPLDVPSLQGDDGEPSDLFNKPIPALPRLNAPGSSVDEVLTENGDEDEELPPETEVIETAFVAQPLAEETPRSSSSSSRYGRFFGVLLVSVLAGVLLALVFR